MTLSVQESGARLAGVWSWEWPRTDTLPAICRANILSSYLSRNMICSNLAIMRRPRNSWTPRQTSTQHQEQWRGRKPLCQQCSGAVLAFNAFAARGLRYILASKPASLLQVCWDGPSAAWKCFACSRVIIRRSTAKMHSCSRLTALLAVALLAATATALRDELSAQSSAGDLSNPNNE